jgi:hypothetical protein
MDPDNTISSCHLLERIYMGWPDLGRGVGQVWDVGGKEKGEGVAGAEGNVGSLGPWGCRWLRVNSNHCERETWWQMFRRASCS